MDMRPDYSRPCGQGTSLEATLEAKPPPRSGSGRDDWHFYDVIFAGETIVESSRVPECDAARALLASGITGKLTLIDGKTGRRRIVVDIERAAKLTVLENARSGPRFVKWKPRPVNCGDCAGDGAETEGGLG